MNEYTEMQGELNPKIKEQIDYIKNLNKINEQKGTVSKEDLTID